MRAEFTIMRSELDLLLVSGRDRIDILLDRAPRIALALAIAMAWALTLVWPPPPASFQPRLAQGSPSVDGYPLRLPLPPASQVTMSELASIVGQYPALAQLGLLPSAPLSPPVPAPETQGASPAQSDRSRNAAQRPGFSITGQGGLLDLDFDLGSSLPSASAAGAGESGGSVREVGDGLEVSKPLFVEGVATGKAQLRIEPGARISIAASSLARGLKERITILPSRLAERIENGNGYVSFDDLRAAGLAVEYDAARDRITLSFAS